MPLEEGDELACKEDDTIACLRIHCASGSPAACWMGGYALTQGRDAPWEGLPWLESACDLGFGRACEELGIIHSGGGTKHVDPERRWPPTDPDRALTRFARACDLGVEASCSAEATRFGTTPDEQRRIRDDHVAMCVEGPSAAPSGSGEGRKPLGSSCRIAAWFFETGRGERDPARACELNRRGCELHDPGACSAAESCP